MAQASVFIDVQVWVRAVEGLRSKKSPRSLQDLGKLPGAETGGVAWLLSALPALGLPVSFGEHIRYNVVKILTTKYGWSAEEATRWADVCEAFCRRSGGSVAGKIERNQDTLVKAHRWGLDDREDAQVFASALEAGSVLVVTADHGILDADRPPVKPMSLSKFTSEMKGLWAETYPQAAGHRPAA